MKKEIRIALLIIAALAIFIWGYTYLENTNLFGEDRDFYAIYPEVKNLSTSNPVKSSGVRVGVVKEIIFPVAPDDYRVLVRLTMDNDMEIPENSVARIESDLLGSNMINLRLGDSEKNLKIGDTLSSEVATTIQEEVNLQMLPVKRKAENLMLELDSVLEVIRYVFNEETREDISASFASIKRTIDNLESTTGNVDSMVKQEGNRLNSIIANITSISRNLRDNNENVTRTFENLARITDTIAQARIGATMAELSTTLKDLQRVTERIENGEGTMGQLINNDSLYNELQSSAKSLDNLVEDIRMNPQRYLHFSVFGKNPNKTRHPDSR